MTPLAAGNFGIARPPLVTGGSERKPFAGLGNRRATDGWPKQFIAYSRLAATARSGNGSSRMTLFAFLGLFPALLGLPAMIGITADAPQDGSVVRRVVIRDEVILRIPVRPRVSPMIEWSEHKGPKCIAINRIAAAMLSGPSSIDFVLRDRSRMRARMDSDCPALDFYDGFYLQMKDDRICAKREAISSRVGTSCRIEKFRELVPQVRQQVRR